MIERPKYRLVNGKAGFVGKVKAGFVGQGKAGFVGRGKTGFVGLPSRPCVGMSPRFLAAGHDLGQPARARCRVQLRLLRHELCELPMTMA